MYTSQMRITGLSGLDTESMIQQLMKAESVKYNNLKKTRQKTVWKQEQYRDVTKTLKTFQNNFLSYSGTITNNLKSAANYRNLTTTIKGLGTDTTGSLITAQATDYSKTGNYSLKVQQLASKDIFTSQNTIRTAITSEPDFDAGNIKAGDTFYINLDGSSKAISFSQDDINDINNNNVDFVNLVNEKLKKAFGQEDVDGVTKNKVEISIDSGTNKLSISTNPGHTVTINEGSRTTNKLEGSVINLSSASTKSFKIAVGGGATKTINVEVTAAMSEADFVKKVNEELKAQGISGVTTSMKDGKLSFTNSNASEQVTISNAGDMGFYAGFTLDNASVLSDMGIASGASTKLNIKSSLETVFAADSTVEFEINGVEFKFDKTDSIENMLTKINGSAAGVKMSYNELKGQFTLESNASGAINSITMIDTTGFLADAFNFDHSETAKDAIITFNGVTTTRTTNNFEIDGIKIGLLEGSEGEEYTLSFSKDTSKTVEFIQKFVEEYNKLVDALKGYYNTSRPKSDKYTYYEPLSDEEKEALSDREIEKYEAKAQEGLLYNDPILQGIASSMRSMLYEPVILENGNKVSLHEFGITTTKSWNDGGKIEVDTAKLEKALEERGDDLVALFTQSAPSGMAFGNNTVKNERRANEGIAERLDDIIKYAVNTNGSLYNKAGIEGSTATNDLSTLIKKQDEKISDMLKLLQKKENDYYLMFSKLETAMNNSNNQLASLQSMLGLE